LVVVTYHDDLKEVQGDPALAALLCGDGPRVPFDRLDWWQMLAEDAGVLPLLAVARDGDERAVLALRRAGRTITALTNWYSFSVRPVFTPGANRAALLEAFARDLPGEAPWITLAPLSDDEGETTLLEHALRKAGWVVFRDACDVNHVLEVHGRSYPEYMAARPGPLRTTLKRKANKVDVTIETEFYPASWEAYEAIYTQSWKPEEGSPAMLRRFAEAEATAGRMRLGIARADGQPVAAQFWTVESGTAFIHKLAHTEASKPLSPGTTLSAALFEHVIDRDGVQMIDFGTGNDPYKRDWMEQVRTRYRLDCYRPGWPGNWPAIGKQLLRRLAGKAKRG